MEQLTLISESGYDSFPSSLDIAQEYHNKKPLSITERGFSFVFPSGFWLLYFFTIAQTRETTNAAAARTSRTERVRTRLSVVPTPSVMAVCRES